MDRRAFVGSLAGGLLAVPFAAAQPAARIPRIGYLAANSLATSPPNLHGAFRQGLRDLGYVEGRNLVIEYREAHGKFERLSALAAELVALKVDVIMAPTTVAALAAMQATRTLPIVFFGATDPVTSGLVANLARPGGNVTGLSGHSPEVVGKCLELLTHAVPGVGRVSVLWQPGTVGERTEQDTLKGAEVAAQALGVRLQIVEARGSADIDRAFSDMTRGGARALTVWTSAMLVQERGRLVTLAAKNRLPAVYTFSEFVHAGGLMSYGHSQADLNRRAAIYVDKILKGSKTAKDLGLTIPPSVLARAEQVIE